MLGGLGAPEPVAGEGSECPTPTTGGDDLVVGIDLGGTKALGVVLDPDPTTGRSSSSGCPPRAVPTR